MITNKRTKENIEKYYKTHTNEETAAYFNISKSQLLRDIAKFKIKPKVKYVKKIPILESVNTFLTTNNIDIQAFKQDCIALYQKELCKKYNIKSIRLLNNIKNFLGINHRLKYLADYAIDKVALEEYYKNHSLIETATAFNIPNITTLKNLLKYYNITIETRCEPIEEAIKRIQKAELEQYYLTHTHAECQKHFKTSNLRAILAFYNILPKTKKHESFESVLQRINKDTFIDDFNHLNLTELFIKYNIRYTIYRKLIKYYNLNYKSGVFSYNNSALSKCEANLTNYIKSILPSNMTILKNDRNALQNGQEIDIYIPEIKLGIEFNGDYWHSDIEKPRDYHFKKSKLATDLDITLLHIYEFEWQNILLKEKIKKLLNNYINQPQSYKEINITYENIKNKLNFKIGDNLYSFNLKNNNLYLISDLTYMNTMELNALLTYIKKINKNYNIYLTLDFNKNIFNIILKNQHFTILGYSGAKELKDTLCRFKIFGAGKITYYYKSIV